MTETEPRRPPAPSPAERAKTIASRDCPALLLPALEDAPGEARRIVPVLHHVHDSGSVTVLLPDDHPIGSATQAADSGELAMMVELTDQAPVELREPIRGLLWVTGWLRPLSAEGARARAVSIARTRPDPRLLDLGHGLSMFRLAPVSFVLADAEGTHSISPPGFGAAKADPFCHDETRWLRHLEHAHADVVTQLARHLPEELRRGRIRPLGLDRHGLRLRVECAEGDHDVRLAFSRAVDSPPQLGLELRKLVGCPFVSRH
ncbi:DUF2470 domain-containing protein [Prauserella muralis]|uniref:DUF2470 domain-containing protein n=1 Tax=Prauserella muralis TaxID=588067 RepID=UPI000DD44279|nr:DUF2470 domain-containing protein [Prauserella muralis]TWE13797.1 uncharacterized protein DUF2470 [Prauserella muralis]